MMSLACFCLLPIHFKSCERKDLKGRAFDRISCFTWRERQLMESAPVCRAPAISMREPCRTHRSYNGRQWEPM